MSRRTEFLLLAFAALCGFLLGLPVGARIENGINTAAVQRYIESLPKPEHAVAPHVYRGAPSSDPSSLEFTIIDGDGTIHSAESMPGFRRLTVRELASMPPMPKLPDGTEVMHGHQATLSEQGRFGLPAGTVYDKGEYLLGFDDRPLWSLEVLHGPLQSVPRAGSFHIDKETGYAADEADYRGSGFDIGHLTPAEDAQKEMSETFSFANACPQNSAMNRGVWARIEAQVRQSVDNGGTAWVVTFPIYAEHPPTIGPHKIPVPKAFAKSELLETGKYQQPVKVACWECPNVEPPAGAKPADYVVSLAKVEADSGLKLWPLVPNNVPGMAGDLSHGDRR